MKSPPVRFLPLLAVWAAGLMAACGSYADNIANHSLFLKSDGSLHAMGQNLSSQLGDGTTTDRSSPVQVLSSGVTQIAAGGYHSLFLKSDGSLHAMGRNDNGQLGDGTTTNRTSPVQILSSGVTQIAAGFSHSLFLKSDGSLHAMGWNNSGQLGDGTSWTDRTSPVQILASGVTQIAAGSTHSLFLKSDGSLHAMGRNNNGQLGDGTTTNRTSPVQILASGVTQIAAGSPHSLFLKSDGSLHAMGWNPQGQLGDGTTTNRSSPVQVLSSGVTQIAAGGYHNLFLKSDGSLHGMGRNSQGQLGDGTRTHRHSPVQILSSGVTQIAAGHNHSLFLKSDGSLHAMGRKANGQLGDGTTTPLYRTSPVQVLSSGVLRLSENVPAAPSITQGAGPLAVTMSEDGSPTAWSAPTLGATDVDTTDSTLVWSVSSAASNGTATVSGTAAAPPTFTYAPNADFNGNDSFVVQVSDGALTDTITVNVTVSGVGDAPVITQGAGPLTVTMSEDGSPTAWSAPTLGATDVETADSALVWSVSSAASNGTATVSGTAAAPPTFTYAPNADFNGSDSFVVQVSDGALTDTITINVTVSGVSDAPVITQGAGPLAATMSEDGSPTAWSAPTLGATDVDTASASLVWSVSSAASNGTATVSGTAAAPTTFTYAPNADFNGSDSFVVQVSDGALTDTITINVTVSGVSDNPVITQGAGPLSVTMSEDGSPTAWSAPTLGATDAETADSALVWSVSSAASNGTATVSGTAAAPSTFIYAPNADFNGSDSFVVQVSDGALTDTITINVTVSGVSDAPVITQGSGPLAVTMSEDGSPTAWSAPTLGATDVDTASASLVWSVSSAASNGTATVSGTAAAPTTFTYAPNADFNGSDSFVVQVSDGALTDTITVNVTVSGVSDAPVITQGAGPLAVTMSEDGSPTAWSAPTLGATDAETADSALVWSVSSAASNGTATVSGTAAAPSTFTYAPNADFNGSDSFVVQVSDGALTDTITVNVTVSGVSDAPVITQGAGPLAVTMSEDGSPTAWSAPTLGATDVDTASASLVWSVSSAASSGTATVSGTAAAPTTFTYAPNADFNGSDSFVVQVSDGALTDTTTVNVTVSGVNDAPVITQGAGPLAVTMSEDGSPTRLVCPHARSNRRRNG